MVNSMCSCFIFIAFCPLAILFLVIAMFHVFSRLFLLNSTRWSSSLLIMLFCGSLLYSTCHFKCQRQKILFIGFIAFHVNLFTPVCFTLPARALHAHTQVTVYHSKLGHYLLSLPNTSSSFLVYVDISSVLQFYRNEDQ